MRTRFNSSRVVTILALSLTAVFLMSANGEAGPPGLNAEAFGELDTAGVFKYLESDEFEGFTSTSSDWGVWTQHTFDKDEGGENAGPICISGEPYSVFTRDGDPKKVLIFLQGGGACWQGFYSCSRSAQGQAPPPNGIPDLGDRFPGVFDSDNPDNVFADYSVVYMPYCDGSAFGGDNQVVDTDPRWLATNNGSSDRFHRGVRNLSAGMDVAADTFPRAKTITVMGHSAGGVGVAAFAPFLARFVYGNKTKLTVHNDAGPIVVNLGQGNPPGDFPYQFPFGCGFDVPCLSVVARAFDWNFAQFYPASCVADGRCDPFGQQTGIIDWRLDNDSTIREAFFETDSDQTNRFFAQGDGSLMDPQVYRELILREHGALNDAHPKRYKRFIVSNDNTHGAVQVTADTTNEQTGQTCFPVNPFSFYTQEANGVLLSDWTAEFVRNGDGDSQGDDIWVDLVEDPVIPVNCPLP